MSAGLAEVLAEHVLGQYDNGGGDEWVEVRSVEELTAAVTEWLGERLREVREEVAERLSLAEMTAYSPEAVEDHNRWSWRGDGHDAAFRQRFYDEADGVLAVVAGALGIEEGGR